MPIEFEFQLEITARQRIAFYVGAFVIGLISLCTVQNQSLVAKVIRPILVTSGAVAGGRLLYDYRPRNESKGNRENDKTENSNGDINKSNDFNGNEASQIEQQKQREVLEFERLERVKEEQFKKQQEQIQKQLEEEKRQYQLEMESVQKQRELMIAEQSAVEERLQKWVDDQQKAWQESIDSQREMYELQIGQLQQRIADLNAIELFTSKHGYAGWIGNQVIGVLLEYELFADGQDCHQLPNSDVMIWVKPRKGVRVRKLKELGEEIQLRLGLEDPPEITIDDDTICITLKPSSQRKSKKEGKDKMAVQEPNKWFPEAIHVANHYFIPGDTGSGKSELVNNIVCMARRELGDDVRIIIIDPKFPDTEWNIDGVEVMPQYKGYQQLELDGKKYPSAYDGLYAMADDMRGRLETATKAKLRSQEIPKRIPTLYIVDEVPDLIANAGDAKGDVVDAILSVVRVGRSSKVKCLLLGQDPSCIVYGFKTTATLKNFSCFYLREFALKGIDDLVPTTTEKSKLKALVQKQLKAAETDPNEQYFALVKYPGRAAFVARLPPPKAYSKVRIDLINGQGDYDENNGYGDSGYENESIEDLVEYALQEEELRGSVR